ncbi:MAG: hypothetical protein A2Y17_01375 [Clostridiales bacterium GWF2_38_85]|nr:MAG: hypothetical protein A2Y17_01375 [Clostridiales bacterium GWF2_38_85]HBL85171.1 hypothetical protein [Clostridiales bacterium]
MKNIIKLTLGEVNRLGKYKILPISLATTLIWCILFFLITSDEAKELTPLFLFADIALMSIILLGASYHLEKQEGTIKSVLMLPVTQSEILISKTIASMFLTLESAIITSIALYFIHGITYNYAILLAFVLVASVAHAAIGMLLSLYSRDFSSMLGILMTYMAVFTIPALFFGFGIIPEKYELLMLISPSQCVYTLVNSAVMNEYDAAKIAIAIGYMILLSVVLFRFVVFPKFKRNSIEI